MQDPAIRLAAHTTQKDSPERVSEVHSGETSSSHRAGSLVFMQEMVRTFIVAVWPDGGQGRARRNAWSAMVSDTKRSRERASAEAVVQGAVAAHEAMLVPVASGH